MRLLPVILLLVVPHVSAADPLFTFAYSELGSFLYLDEEHHDTPEGSHQSTVQGINWQGGELTTPAGTFWADFEIEPWAPLTVMSGPFISKVETFAFDEEAGESYLVDAHSRFAAGGTLSAPWVIELPDGTTRALTFTADLGPWEIHYDHNNGRSTVPFSNGRFNSNASFLGLPSQGFSGSWQIQMDRYYREDEGNNFRVFTMFGEIQALEVTAVPEPSVGLLLLAGLLARKWRAA